MMQKDYLFDDDDPKQLGHGVDSLRQNGDNLKAHWQWTRGRGSLMPETNRRCIGQTSEAEIGECMLLEVVLWSTHYEARVLWMDNSVISYNVDEEESNHDVPMLLTRVDAQRKSEELARQFINEFTAELTDVGM